MRRPDGNVMPMAAIGLIALAAMIGGGVDVSRGYMAENRLQNACDSGVLAGRKAVAGNGYTTTAQAKADDYFTTNFDADEQDVQTVSFVSSTPDNGNTIEGTATATMDTAVMQLFGYETMPLSAECEASMSIGNSDVMMVLDTTGSMASDLDGKQTRIQALREAMKNFYDTVSVAAEGGNGRVRFGFVPYSSAVNVGRLILNENPDYLVDSWTYQSREPQYTETVQQTQTGYGPPVYTSDTGYGNERYDDWELHSYTKYKDDDDCTRASPKDTTWQNFGSSTTSVSTEIKPNKQRVTTTTKSQPERRLHYTCYRYRNKEHYIIKRYEYRDYNRYEYATENPTYTTTTTSDFRDYRYMARNFDTSQYKTFGSVSTLTGDGGTNRISTWQGCIEERDTVAQDTFSYSQISGWNPAGVLDLDIDTVPDPSDDATKWRPMWPGISYLRTDSTYRYLNGAAVSEYGVAMKDGIYGNMYSCPMAARLLATMNQGEFYAYADSLVPSGNTYHDLGMIWGGRLTSAEGIFASNVTSEPDNAGAVTRHIIFMTDGDLVTSASSLSSYGIEWHDKRITDNGFSNQNTRHEARFRAVCNAIKAKGVRIWVIAFASELTTEIETCASPQSSFPAANANQLNQAFQDIGRTIGELRIVQ